MTEADQYSVELMDVSGLKADPPVLPENASTLICGAVPVRLVSPNGKYTDPFPTGKV